MHAEKPRELSPPTTAGIEVFDVHSKLQRVRVRDVLPVRGTAEIRHALALARSRGCAVSLAGGRHAMGGQQFGEDSLLLDLRSHDRIRTLDRERGLVEVESGVMWPALVENLLARQRVRRGRPERAPLWTIRQKQTGADRLTIGGSVSANAHGRGLAWPPFVSEVESLTLIDGEGECRTLSRDGDPSERELFRHAIGGYGLFGVLDTVTLRLAPRRKLERRVEICTASEALPLLEWGPADGYLYGDFQLAIDPADPGFLRRGVLSRYRPVAPDTPMPEVPAQPHLDEQAWRELVYLAHADKRRAWELYSRHYLATDGQLYWSDTHQLSVYLDDYHEELDRRLGSTCPATEVITELFVPRQRLVDFLEAVADDFRRHRVECIYSTVRMIERDCETALPWARERWACVIFNLHTEHTATGIERSAAAFRRLLDLAIARDGSTFLTYHRHARMDQLLACYPELPQFLAAKRLVDPELRFQSDWYRALAKLESTGLTSTATVEGRAR
jgi:FAD/FMN-containing dehydrogenase